MVSVMVLVAGMITSTCTGEGARGAVDDVEVDGAGGGAGVADRDRPRVVEVGQGDGVDDEPVAGLITDTVSVMDTG